MARFWSNPYRVPDIVLIKEKLLKSAPLRGVVQKTPNTDAFFESIAKKFDKDCQILKNNPQAQFIAGLASAGMSLGAQSIPKFCVVFHFSVEDPIEEAENLLNKLKPAHVKFIYQLVSSFPTLKVC